VIFFCISATFRSDSLARSCEAWMMEPTKETGSGEKEPLGRVVQIDEGRIQALWTGWYGRQ
jgi:hypothetical protein